MRISICLNDLGSIKAYLKRSIPDHKASHRIEAAARGLGYTTYSSLRAALVADPFQVEANDRRFCASLGIAFQTDGGKYNRFLSRALARVELHRILDAHDRLTQRGFDSAWMGSRDEMSLPLGERMALLAERRRDCFESDWSFDQFELAWIYLSRQRKIKSINRRTGSYGLKHRAENLMREYGLFEPLGNYVSNGMLIAAAYSLGFEVSPIAHDSYNAYFNISMATINRSRGRQPRTAMHDSSLITSMYGYLNLASSI